MKSLSISKLPFLKSRFDFTTSLSLSICENRLEDLGASIREADPIGKRRSITFFLKHPDFSFLWHPALSGELQEIENGTLMRAHFYPNRLFFGYIYSIGLLFYILYIKDYIFVFLPIVTALITAVFIACHRSSWNYLKRKVIKALKHWKKE